MRKGQQIGCNKRQGGSYSGEKYITFEVDKQRYRVLITIGIGKQKHFGYYRDLQEAIMCRDKAMSEVTNSY